MDGRLRSNARLLCQVFWIVLQQQVPQSKQEFLQFLLPLVRRGRDPHRAYQIIMLEVAICVEVEADQDSDDLRVGHHALPAAFRSVGRRRKGFLAISASNSLQKSSAIQKISVTLLSVIMICILKFITSKLLNINDITKRIGNFSKLPIQLFQGFLIPNSR